VNLRLEDKRLTIPKSKRFLSCITLLERKRFKGVVVYEMQSLVSIFKTAKPSSLGLDHSRKRFIRKDIVR